MRNLLILTLATWRIANLLVNEEGPGQLFVRLRALAGVRYDGEEFERQATTPWAGAFVCVWCMSVWVGLGWAAAWRLWPKLTLGAALPFALSAGAVLVDEAVNS